MEDLGAEDPRWIGEYRLLRRLGAGGMGRVFLAHSARGRTVAVKLVQTELAQQAEFRRRFKQEVRAAQRVGGAWTAPVLDADTEAATPWVATGYIAGPSLHAIVAESGRLPERTVRIMAHGLTQALRDIHDAGLVHRDLKPSNVLVTIDGPRVIDFGIARALETVTDGILTRSGAVVGSPGFMSPEQVRGERVTPASDVFCLGSVLAYAATGRQPFGTADSGVHAVMYRIAQEEPDLEGLPEGLRDLVTDCLKKAPDDRPSLDALLERTAGADDDGEPWLPGTLVAQLGRHAVQLLEVETPAGPGVPARPAVPPMAGAAGPAVPPPPAAPPSATSYPWPRRNPTPRHRPPHPAPRRPHSRLRPPRPRRARRRAARPGPAGTRPRRRRARTRAAPTRPPDHRQAARRRPTRAGPPTRPAPRRPPRQTPVGRPRPAERHAIGGYAADRSGPRRTRKRHPATGRGAAARPTRPVATHPARAPRPRHPASLPPHLRQAPGRRRGAAPSHGTPHAAPPRHPADRRRVPGRPGTGHAGPRHPARRHTRDTRRALRRTARGRRAGRAAGSRHPTRGRTGPWRARERHPAAGRRSRRRSPRTRWRRNEPRRSAHRRARNARRTLRRAAHGHPARGHARPRRARKRHPPQAAARVPPPQLARFRRALRPRGVRLPVARHAAAGAAGGRGG
ncbi:serine/threonine-protein kinase [Streptomyces rapamycinicus]|uniref:serine/threonine-protein kinase n=1 Tax=Streptomyces rapamycinicus TaxID=1226757 RepID=UPI0032D8F3A4